MFYIIAGFLVFGIVFFGIFARGEVQDWAKEEVDDTEAAEEADEVKQKPEEMKMLGGGGDVVVERNGHVV